MYRSDSRRGIPVFNPFRTPFARRYQFINNFYLSRIPRCSYDRSAARRTNRFTTHTTHHQSCPPTKINQEAKISTSNVRWCCTRVPGQRQIGSTLSQHRQPQSSSSRKVCRSLPFSLTLVRWLRSIVGFCRASNNCSCLTWPSCDCEIF